MASDVEIVVAEDPAQDVAERLAAAARKGGHVVLTGGSTPRIAYGLAAKLETDWTGVEIWWGDERCVPPDDERSNYGMAKEALLDHVTVGTVHRMRGELGRDQGAELYEQELGELERFDLVLLGLGPDGHIASLYPEQPTLDETERRVVGAEAKLEPYVDRITLTLPMLRRALRGAVPRHGQGQSGRREARISGRAVARDTGQPRALDRRQDDCRARRRRCGFSLGQYGRRLEVDGEVARGGELLQHEHRVGHGDVLEEVRALLERVEDVLQRDLVVDAVRPCDLDERIRNGGWKVSGIAKRRREDARSNVVAQHQ